MFWPPLFQKTNKRVEPVKKTQTVLLVLSPRMKSFDSSLNSLNPGFTDDNLYHVIESFQLLDSTKEDRPDKNKTDLDWF